MSARATEHHFAVRGEHLPPVDESLWLDYVVGSGGIYARGRRPGLEVCMPVAGAAVRGLRGVHPYVQWGFPVLPARFLERMLSASRARCAETPTEALFHLTFEEAGRMELVREGSTVMDFHQGWHLEYPEQSATHDHVKPLRQGRGSSEARAVVEVHSHPHGDAYFSEVDDADEGGTSFRVYGVLGRVFERPAVCVRVALFGYFMPWPASEFFELPPGVIDCVRR
jgi:PRTRC genetic system protein A